MIDKKIILKIRCTVSNPHTYNREFTVSTYFYFNILFSVSQTFKPSQNYKLLIIIRLILKNNF